MHSGSHVIPFLFPVKYQYERDDQHPNVLARNTLCRFVLIFQDTCHFVEDCTHTNMAYLYLDMSILHSLCEDSMQLDLLLHLPDPLRCLFLFLEPSRTPAQSDLVSLSGKVYIEDSCAESHIMILSLLHLWFNSKMPNKQPQTCHVDMLCL